MNSAWTNRLVQAGIILLPLVCWPGLERPFSTPKTWLLAGLSLVVLVGRPSRSAADPLVGSGPAAANRPGQGTRRGPGGPPHSSWPLLLWLAATSLAAAIAPLASFQALLLAVLPLPLCWAVREGKLDADSLKRDILLGSSLLAAVAVLQSCSLDPLKLLGWRPETFTSPRMRVYGTLGNPNFVAAWLCATLPLHAGTKNKAAVASLALQLGGILATGSRVFLLALPAAAAVLAVRRVPAAKWWCVAGVPVAAALLWLSPARPLGTTAEGRLYLARVAAPHLLEIPPAGYGPGAFGPMFAQWQASWLQNNGPRRYAGELDHAHNDYLEFWTEYGPIGLCAFFGVCTWLLFKPRDAAALAAAVCLLAAACVDFPFHRPAEWGLFWLLAGMQGVPNRQGELKCPSH